MRKRHIDMLDQGDIWLLDEPKQIAPDKWKVPAEAILMNEAAEYHGVHHGTRIKGTLFISTIEDNVKDPIEADWEYWDFEDFEIIEYGEGRLAEYDY